MHIEQLPADAAMWRSAGIAHTDGPGSFPVGDIRSSLPAGTSYRVGGIGDLADLVNPTKH